RFVQARGAVEARDAALRQNPVGAELRLAEIDRYLGAVCEIVRCRASTTLPQGKMLVVEHLRAAARADLGEAARQDRRDQANVVRKGGVDRLVQGLGDARHGRLLGCRVIGAWLA